MATELILTIFIIFSFLFLIIGIVARVITKNTTMSSLIFMSAVLFLITSFMILGEGIAEKTGINETKTYTYNNATSLELNNTTTTTTYNYSYQKSIFINALGIALLLLSLILFYSSIFDLATGEGL